MRHYVMLDEREESSDSVGARSVLWRHIGTVHAAIQPISGKENFVAEHYSSSADVKITVRSTELTRRITPTHRVRHAGVIYDIKGVVPDVTGRINIRLICKRHWDDRLQN